MPFIQAFILLFFLSWVPSTAQQITIEKEIESIPITSFGLMYCDTSKNLSVQEIMNLPKERFQHINSDIVRNRRKSGSSVWIRWDIENTSRQKLDFIFSTTSDNREFHYYHLDRAFNILHESKGGRSIPPESHYFRSIHVVFPVSLSSQSVSSILIKMDSDDFYFEKFELLSPPTYQRIQTIRTFIEGIIHGLLIMVAIISLILFLITRSKTNLWYLLYVVTNSLGLHVAMGYFNYLFFPQMAFGHHAQYIVVLISSIFFFKFIITYYSDQGLPPSLNRIFNIYTILIIFFFGMMFLDYVYTLGDVLPPFLARIPMILLSLISIGMYGIIFCYAIKKPNVSNIGFALAFSLLLYSSSTTVMFRNGIISEHFYTPHSYALSVVFEFIILTFLLSIKVIRSYAENALMQVKIASQQKELEHAAIIKKSHDEKDTLLREIHHRVKNNLQVISALLTLQSRHLKDTQAKIALKEGQDRVQSMALIHKDLYQHDNLKGVNTKEYLGQLANNLVDSYKLDDLQLSLDIDEITLDVDTMIPLGLMVNELISNALKHAFSKNEKGHLSLSLKKKQGVLLLKIRDNGRGAVTKDLLESKSFGYSLVKSFARKLDADLIIKNDNGLSVELSIKNFQLV